MKHRAPRPTPSTRPHPLGLARQALCALVLAATLSAAAAGLPPTAEADDAAPGPDSPQARPRGNARIEIPLDPPDETSINGQQNAPDGDHGIPATALKAYKNAAATVARTQPGCHLPWELVAGIGRVESVHASGYGLRVDGTTVKPIRGPRLDGNGFALIRDTDGGVWDGDTEYDRAVGPLQFIPSTWATWGADGNGDGKKDPGNIFDAALAAGRYLCAGGKDLSKPADLDKAVLSYNNSRAYVNTVLGWMRTYQGSAHELPDPTPAADSRDSSNTTKPPAPTTSTPPKPDPSPVPSPTPKPPVHPAPPRPTPTPAPPAPAPPKPAPVTGLDAVGDPHLGETGTGGDFPQRARVRASRADGTPAAGIPVVFTLAGDTDASFPGQVRRATVRTDARGLATAPALAAGERPGGVELRATHASLPPVRFTATVRNAAADTLTRVGEEPLVAEAGTEFAPVVTVRATRAGQPLAGVPLTARVLTPAGDETAVGPWFTGPEDVPVRYLELPLTDTDGLVRLPTLHAGTAPGPFLLRLSTVEGVALDVSLLVTPQAKRPSPPVALARRP
ncbi:lytic transglycosylase domain-containing protein [Streptomyces sp. NPDC001941]|uniref:lytic transglycosylase domain-containing protein n=1 Tax=Streptomyces sp. NPDC001941 TaxID=3154659 RepID=UPI003316EF68